MRVVVALGGNALLTRHDRPEADIQRRHVRSAARQLTAVAARHSLVVCHGNGPQIGLLAAESEDDQGLSRPYPLDVLGAQTQGMIGYWLAQELRSAGFRAPVAAVVTQTEVAGDDEAFTTPTKFIGPVMTKDEAVQSTQDRGWTVARDGERWRRVVPSPSPRRVVEMPVIRQLVDAGVLVICGGGGGVPVVAGSPSRDVGEGTAAGSDGSDGSVSGVEAVVDKDLTAALVAAELEADVLAVLTDVDAVKVGFGTAAERSIAHIAAEELAAMSFPAGSMRPKVEGCLRFVAATGGRAAIGALGDIEGVVDGRAGTQISPGG